MSVDQDGVARPAVGRRSFLNLGLSAIAAAAASSVLVPAAPALAVPAGPSVRRLSLLNINTRETFDGVYWSAETGYARDALQKLNVLLRDHRANQVCKYDPGVFDVLWQVRQTLGSTEPYEVICGYRTRRTNAMSRRRSRGVAKESYHIRGMAIDVRLADCDIRSMSHAAIELGRGGVGTYPRSGFVHLDTGPVRAW